MPTPPPEPAAYGPIYTRGASFRARAEARQRRHRAEVLMVGWSDHGHWLDDAATAAGANFVVPSAHRAARARAAAGKGVTERTFRNMLSSQAMAFNVFAPMAEDPDLATRVLAPLVPGLRAVRSIQFEYTPASDVFRDQSALGGVDCDLLVEATFDDGRPAVLTVETKLVEQEFSTCGHRKKGACPEDVPVSASRAACRYVSSNRFAYWERADAHDTLLPLPPTGCPFGGPLWQLWVNHTLAHVEAGRRGADHARYLVCAPRGNDALLRGGAVTDRFRAVLARPDTAGMLALDDVIARIAEVAEDRAWVEGVEGRYARL